MKKEIVINASKDRARIAIVENGELAELYVEHPENVRTLGNIYLGRVAKVMPQIHAAFVDIGQRQDAFLHFSDLTDNAAQLFAIAGMNVPGLESGPILSKAPKKRVADDESEPDVEDTLEVEDTADESSTARSRSRRRRRRGGRGRRRGRGGSQKRSEEEEEQEERRLPHVIDLTQKTGSVRSATTEAVAELEADVQAEEPPAEAPASVETPEEPEASQDAPEAEEKPKRSRSRSRKKKTETPTEEDADAQDAEPSDEAPASVEETAEVEDAPEAEEKPKRRRSRSRGRKKKASEEAATPEESDSAETPDTTEPAATEPEAPARKTLPSTIDLTSASAPRRTAPAPPAAREASEDATEAEETPKRRRSRSRSRTSTEAGADASSADAAPEAEKDAEASSSSRRSRSRRGRSRDAQEAQTDTADEQPSGRSRRGRGGSSREATTSEPKADEKASGGRSRGGSGGGNRGRNGRGGQNRGASGGSASVPTKPEELLARGERVLVKITKEPISSKGSRVSTDISLAGRFLVLVPAADYVAVSKKIESAKERRRLRTLATSLKPDNFGVIVRTVAKGRDAKILDQDLRLLVDKWRKIEAKLQRKPEPPVLLYEDVSMVSSIVRDLFTEDYDRILVDDPRLHKNVQSYVKAVAPQMADRVVLHRGNQPVFRSVGLEKQVAEAFSERVNMKGGGYLIIEHTEAMHVVDVNSGRAGRGKRRAEENLLNVNVEAAREIAKQLRLRDLGGIIVVDFIDLRYERDRRKVTEAIKKEFAKDRAVTKVIGMSDFGVMQITRQRLRPSITTQSDESDDAQDAMAAAGAAEIPQPERRARDRSAEATEADRPEERPRRARRSPAEDLTPVQLAARLSAWLTNYRDVVDARYANRPIVVGVHPLMASYLRGGFPSRLTRLKFRLRSLPFQVEENPKVDPLEFAVRDRKSGRSLLSKYPLGD
ncbi:MAG: Rne/Rng family ribonuclease [Bacteroidota bacterium]